MSSNFRLVITVDREPASDASASRNTAVQLAATIANENGVSVMLEYAKADGRGDWQELLLVNPKPLTIEEPGRRRATAVSLADHGDTETQHQSGAPAPAEPHPDKAAADLPERN